MTTAITTTTGGDALDMTLIREKLAPKADDADLALFGALCQRTGLDPFRRQIYLIPRWDSRLKKEVHQPQVSIDGLRLIAQRSGEMDGQDGPYWCGADGIWRDVWLSPERPAAAKVTVFRRGCRAGFTGIALMSEYMPLDKDGRPSGLWGRMPAGQIAKCAESLALRKAHPQEMSGLYTTEELPPEDAPPPSPVQQLQRAAPDTQENLLARVLRGVDLLYGPENLAIEDILSQVAGTLAEMGCDLTPVDGCDSVSDYLRLVPPDLLRKYLRHLQEAYRLRQAGAV
jgi:phage recombination protein Bet